MSRRFAPGGEQPPLQGRSFWESSPPMGPPENPTAHPENQEGRRRRLVCATETVNPFNRSLKTLQRPRPSRLLRCTRCKPAAPECGIASWSYLFYYWGADAFFVCPRFAIHSSHDQRVFYPAQGVTPHADRVQRNGKKANPLGPWAQLAYQTALGRVTASMLPNALRRNGTKSSKSRSSGCRRIASAAAVG
jgi:hypothetical protein